MLSAITLLFECKNCDYGLNVVRKFRDFLFNCFVTCRLRGLFSLHLLISNYRNAQHRPPPNASIIELLNDFCNAKIAN